jgi:glycosyltransferase involved in cell wall biosynthesis
MPVSGRFPLDKITWRVWKFRLRSAMHKLGFKKPIIWLSKPEMSHFIGSFDEKLIVYHVVDEYSAYENSDTVTRENVRISEKKMMRRSDLVIVVSQKLYQTKSKYNEHTYIVPNGVDYTAYSKVLTNNTQMPNDISQLQKPIIGYSGLISSRLDLDLIKYIAKSRSEWTLVFIGAVNDIGCRDDLNRIREMSNVYFLGNKKIDLVPHYVKVFDVCIIPYESNEQTQNLSPLKLYDFMAMGKEIVTTDFPAAQQFKELIYIANSKVGFIDCVEKALFEPQNNLYKARRHVASLNTWENRVKQISRLIETRLAQN